MTRKKKKNMPPFTLLNKPLQSKESSKKKEDKRCWEQKRSKEKVQDNRSAPGLGKNQSGLEQEEKNGREVSE